MARSLFVSAISPQAGKAVVSLGVIELALQGSSRVGFFRPVIVDTQNDVPDEDIDLLRQHFGLAQSYASSYSWRMGDLMRHLTERGIESVLAKIVEDYKRLEEACDFIVIEGTDYLGQTLAMEFDLNALIARTLSSPVIIVGRANASSPEDAVNGLRAAMDGFRLKMAQVIGVVLTRVDENRMPLYEGLLAKSFTISDEVLGVLPEKSSLGHPTVREITEHLHAEVISGQSRLDGVVEGYMIAAMYLNNILSRLKPGLLILTSGDRLDILLGMIEADRSLNAPRLAGILLTGGIPPSAEVMRLIEGLEGTLPIILAEAGTYTVASSLEHVHARLDPDHPEKILAARHLFEQHARLDLLKGHISDARSEVMTPQLFTYGLLQKARARKRHVVLCEGTEPRVLKAAAELVARKAVTLTLLGKPIEVARATRETGLDLDLDLVTIVDPFESPRLEAYAQTYCELRKHKGVTIDQARDLMHDVSFFGTMMVYLGEADGMVSGAIHTTQHTIRPALQIIKTLPDCPVVSSVFFMCLDDGVMVYGDCAVNPDPTPEDLAEIAIRSAETASLFGVTPRVALLSYSTGESGVGVDVDKVKSAVLLAQKKRPDLLLEGPMQYDAAVDATVGKLKLPGSRVAGCANVLIFPDLNTGNNTYKAVQRETGALAIGPVLQGLKRPVNDLSRGCTVEDIVNTVLITAIQS
jgi:phosphate acetyltransferase